MSLFPFRKPKTITTLLEQGGAAFGGIKETATRVTSHVEALWQLLLAELQEYAQFQLQRVLLLLLGTVLLLFGYLLLCAFVCVLLQAWWGSWLLSIGVVCVLHLAASVSCLLIGARRKPGSAAPLTKQELQNDLQCLKLLFNRENKKS
jgi:uncharacterized membrane protein YqjE